MIKLVLPIEPVPASRPRFATRGAYTTAYIPKKQREYQNDLGYLVRSQYTGGLFVDKPLKVGFKFYTTPPKHQTKKRQALIEKEALHNPKRPDTDNFIKLAMDACMGIIWKDDNICVDVRGEKYYSYKPRVEIEIEVLKE